MSRCDGKEVTFNEIFKMEDMTHTVSGSNPQRGKLVIPAVSGGSTIAVLSIVEAMALICAGDNIPPSRYFVYAGVTCHTD